RRPAHLALAAVLAVGMVGGVAAAAGTGVLPHFGDGEPEPGASVSAAATPGRPFVSPSAPQVAPSPENSPSGGAGSRDTAGGDTGAAPGTGSDGPGAGSRRDWSGSASACRDLRDGKNLDPTRKRSLEGAAGGTSRVWKYCKGVLSGADTRGDAKSGPDDRNGDGNGDGKGEDTGSRDDNDKSGHGDRDGHGNGNDHHDGQFTSPRKNHHAPDGGTSGAPLASPGATMSPTPWPSPSYSAI
ncbi:MAG: hypothetical protein JF598_17195, partial [Streptomyces sp.]|nr:hypothetical protein [Streptomyces sp.]